VGLMGIIAGFVILSYYSVIAGWATAYIFKSGAYMAAGADPADVFVSFITSPVTPIIWHAIFMLICIGIVMAGIEKGIEKYSKILMPALVIILLVLIVRSLTLPGAGAGLSFYLKPDFGKLSAEGILAALGQAFFSLSLGMGCMITYGSYLKKDQDIPANSYWIAGTDTAIALLAGFAIFPAVFAFCTGTIYIDDISILNLLFPIGHELYLKTIETAKNLDKFLSIDLAPYEINVLTKGTTSILLV
ncbi:unnamed protein product, partial [marine sediment metagenome]